MDLRGRHPIDTFQYLVNTDGTFLYNGSGSVIPQLNLTTSYALYQVLWEESSSYASSSTVSDSSVSSSWASASISSSYANTINRVIVGDVSLSGSTNIERLYIIGDPGTGGRTATIQSSPAGLNLSVDSGVVSFGNDVSIGAHDITTSGGKFLGTSSYAENSLSASWASGGIGGLTQEIYFTGQSFTTMSFVNGILTSVI